MQVTVQLKGLSRVLARLDKIKHGLTRIPVGEVYVRGDRASVAAAHATGTGTMPARNPFFLDRSQVGAVRARMRQGVREIQQGLASGMRQTMSDAAKVAADAQRDNLERQRHSPWAQDVASPTRMVPLSKAYAKAKRAKYGAKGILQATGKLLRSIDSRIKGG